ncbi:sulfite exporter TauE/SafE family protein [Microvirga aerilata]|uniref:Probable membrane transporter protein n=1 Tax=Microvirga aerilata TaxID=670292 RepID=A0A937D3V5_9HYPH|nr:sulfite exporter TauE/SafE family protein [Microvirga aerilata]
MYWPLVGVVLLIAATRLLWPKPLNTEEWRDPPILLDISGGDGIGFLSGLTGIGGGIFLSLLLLFVGWSETKTAFGVAAVFILVNSIAGLLGNLTSVGSLPSDLPLLLETAFLGAVIGTTLGIKLATPIILKAFKAVLVIAGLKMIRVC